MLDSGGASRRGEDVKPTRRDQTLMEFRKSKPISLRTHESFNEKWLQTLLADDPSLLGLGELDLRDAERRQPHAGRLDLLLSDPETNTRYEVEIQLGPTDESHIIRTIEYWDIEKMRYPQYEHVAVIVAEDITSRFLNVINLFNRAIPLIAVQMRALDVDGVCTLNATTVLNVVRLGLDEEDEPGQTVDRNFWTKSVQSSVELADRVLNLVNEITPGMDLKYNKHYVGLARGGIADNFMSFRPRKEYLVTEFRIPRSDEVGARIEESGMDTLPYDNQWGNYRIRLTGTDISAEHDLLLDLIRLASGTPQSASEPAEVVNSTASQPAPVVTVGES